ncbi:hypothetical protein GOP47_0001640 [Adiantum capillus-veneris]|uniref:Uncharacterized protein n=1 Tax=Adiantum capillus-veneris TaxID=13818 RepID=A0A9D4VAF8_ADICA|nr:hypothetical protein GOP47_0001640 [Adiantum capillus-veneris]
MHSGNMASASMSQSSLLSITDDMVRIFQSLITTLSDQYEAGFSSHSIGACMSNLEALRLACADLHQKLATLWPCEKQYVAVLGSTGCGKSTLLNLLLSMMCPSGRTYAQGIRADSARAVLRDTARVHVVNARSCSIRAEIEDDDSCKNSEVSPNEADCSSDCVSEDLLVSERVSFEGVLGICCAQDKPSYMSEHIPHYDKHPFILRNGRMGDAGTTKVTSVEYGPKFVGHIRWMTRKKMRKKLRDLRQTLDSIGDSSPLREQLLLELKEFWHFVRQLVNFPSSTERPTEEQINVVINDLGTKRKLLDKEERIECAVSKGFNVDRVFVREGIKKKLDQQLGKLLEDLRIEVPVASFEGGISFLDVPGTNDPRVLHQRETRDAIDRTSLILLVLDKSVMDNQTQASLAESPLLERMLMDVTAGCSLVVVGIAEKNTNKGQSPTDVIAGFDPKGNVLKTLKKVFQKIASRLCKSKRIQKEHALQRTEDLFTSFITVIPVLPFLCASLHLSPSNSELHRTFCQSEGKVSCPLRMSKAELRERCMETNIPHLLEKVHSVRVPPTEKELLDFMDSTLSGLGLLTNQTMADNSYVEFLETEGAHALSVSSEDLCFEIEEVVVNIEDALLQSVDECKLELHDINEICETVGENILSQLQTGRFSLGPFILRGFCPEVMGQRANKLISSVDKESKRITDQAYKYLFGLRGDAARLDAVFEKINNDTLPMAITLHDQLENNWKLSLHRLRAKWFCGGIDGGLLGQVREALRKAYNGALKYLAKELKKRSKSTDIRETLRLILEGNALGAHAAKVVKTEVDKAFDKFWNNLSQSLNAEVQFLWKSWQADIYKLAKSTRNILQLQKEGELDSYMLDNVKAENERFCLFQKELKTKEEELGVLRQRLKECVIESQEGFEYGYSLLQSDNVVGLRLNRNKGLLHTAESPRGGGRRGSPKTISLDKNSECSDMQTWLNEPRQGDACEAVLGAVIEENLHGPENQARKKDAHLGGTDAHSRHKLLGASSSPANIPKLGSFLGRSSRKAQVLSDAESVKLQQRQNSAKRLKK